MAVVHRNRLKLCYEDPEPGSQLEIPDLPQYGEEQEMNGGTTTIDNNIPHNPQQQTDGDLSSAILRPTRNRRPPDRYGPFVTH